MVWGLVKVRGLLVEFTGLQTETTVQKILFCSQAVKGKIAYKNGPGF